MNFNDPLLDFSSLLMLHRELKRLSISDFSLIDKPKQVFFEKKGLSIREKSLIDKTGLPKKVWQYLSSFFVLVTKLCIHF